MHDLFDDHWIHLVLCILPVFDFFLIKGKRNFVQFLSNFFSYRMFRRVESAPEYSSLAMNVLGKQEEGRARLIRNAESGSEDELFNK